MSKTNLWHLVYLNLINEILIYLVLQIPIPQLASNSFWAFVTKTQKTQKPKTLFFNSRYDDHPSSWPKITKPHFASSSSNNADMLRLSSKQTEMVAKRAAADAAKLAKAESKLAKRTADQASHRAAMITLLNGAPEHRPSRPAARISNQILNDNALKIADSVVYDSLVDIHDPKDDLFNLIYAPQELAFLRDVDTLVSEDSWSASKRDELVTAYNIKRMAQRTILANEALQRSRQMQNLANANKKAARAPAAARLLQEKKAAKRRAFRDFGDESLIRRRNAAVIDRLKKRIDLKNKTRIDMENMRNLLGLEDELLEQVPVPDPEEAMKKLYEERTNSQLKAWAPKLGPDGKLRRSDGSRMGGPGSRKLPQFPLK